MRRRSPPGGDGTEHGGTGRARRRPALRHDRTRRQRLGARARSLPLDPAGGSPRHAGTRPASRAVNLVNGACSCAGLGLYPQLLADRSEPSSAASAGTARSHSSPRSARSLHSGRRLDLAMDRAPETRAAAHRRSGGRQQPPAARQLRTAGRMRSSRTTGRDVRQAGEDRRVLQLLARAPAAARQRQVERLALRRLRCADARAWPTRSCRWRSTARRCACNYPWSSWSRRGCCLIARRDGAAASPTHFGTGCRR